jgi:hypothetical protein
MSPTDDQIKLVMLSRGFDFIQARNHLIGRVVALEAHEQARRKARMEAEDKAIAYEQAYNNGAGVQP